MNDGRQRQWAAAAAVAESRKRKERDVAAEFRRVHLTTRHEPPPPAQKSPAAAGGGGNRLLAGYLAHEFLTLGTLFGQRWDPPAAVKPPAPPLRAVGKSGAPPPPPSAGEAKQGKPPSGYAEVACLLKAEGAHIPGIVNPTQLARWLQM